MEGKESPLRMSSITGGAPLTRRGDKVNRVALVCPFKLREGRQFRCVTSRLTLSARWLIGRRQELNDIRKRAGLFAIASYAISSGPATRHPR